MTNKKALNILFSGPVGYTLNEYNEASNVIYKSLERLETLNNVWHKNEPMESVDINANNLQELYDFNNKLTQENEALKKALDILKKYYKIIVKDCDFPIYETPRYTLGIRFHSWNEKPEGLFAHITKEDFELLKEVLGE